MLEAFYIQFIKPSLYSDGSITITDPYVFFNDTIWAQFFYFFHNILYTTAMYYEKNHLFSRKIVKFYKRVDSRR